MSRASSTLRWLLPFTLMTAGCAGLIERAGLDDDGGEAKAPIETPFAPDAGNAPAIAEDRAPDPEDVPPESDTADRDATEDVPGCDRKTIGEESGPLAVAYGIENGRLAAAPCFGEPSAVVADAWTDLAAISPPALIEGVVIVAGFTGSDDTLAYAVPVDNDSDEHLIALAIDAAVDDPQELRLTMAHELAHVFTQTPDQIDVAVFSAECETFFNGFGCYQVDAYMTAWIDQFWPPQVIDSLPSDHSVDIEGGEDRCETDPTFPGSYAASHPEEDFAEAFSAYVFDVELSPSLDERMAFFDQYPEFVEMRNAVRDLAAPAPPGNFERCG